MDNPFVGQEVDGYRILDVLGQGGMGIVYKARNVSLDRIEALKVIAPALVQNAQFLRRFRREAQTLARIHHPNIVTVYTLRHAEIGHYLTMEYVEGQTLADLLVDGQGMEWREAIPIIKQLLKAFDYAHKRGIIHRDIKPRNVMLTADREVKVMDFGLAKFYQRSDVTQTQGVSGTLCYMSPEQIKGHSKLDQRSDIFSLGMTLYEMLSGQLPFDKNDSQFSIQRSIVEEEFPAPHRFNEHLPARLSAVIMKAVHKEPEQRYQHAEEMLSAIEAFEAEMERATVGSLESAPDRSAAASASPDRWAGSWKKWVISAGLIGGVAWAAWAVRPALYDPGMDEQAARAVPEHVEHSIAGATDGQRAAEAADSMKVSPEPEKVVQTIEPPEAKTTPAIQSDPPSERKRPEPVATTAERTDENSAGPGEMTNSDAQLAADRTASANREPERSPADEQRAKDEAETRLVEEPDEVREETAASEDVSGSKPEIQPMDRVRSEMGSLQQRLRQAIMDQQWAGMPAPVADYYGDMLDSFYSKFDVVRVESTTGELQAEGTSVTMPVTVYISYRQKGREGIKAFPVPAVWVWSDQEEGLLLSRVHEP